MARDTRGHTARRGGRLLLATVLLGLAALAVVWGRNGLLSRATAAPEPGKASPPAPTNGLQLPSDYSRRAVAYIQGPNGVNIPVTREELGEYLIAREGAEKLELLVNKRIIEMACKQQGIEVTAAEVDADLKEALDGMKLQQKEFVDRVLKQYNKSLYEWKEDVIRPKILMTKLVRAQNRVHATDEELRMAFEAHYGEKVHCRIIMFRKEEKQHVMTMYADIRDNEKEFDRLSRQQASGTLAASGGEILPFGRHTTGNEELEKEAFSLKPGEVSRLLETPEGLVIIKCLSRGQSPQDASVKFEQVRAALEKEVLDKKTQLEIGVCFKELRDKAAPQLILKKYNSEEDWLREIQKEIFSGMGAAGSPPSRN